MVSNALTLIISVRYLLSYNFVFCFSLCDKVLKSGFFISDTHPFLGASPDGLVDEDKIVEVKKIVLKEGESLEDGMCRLGIYKRFEQQLVLNNSHKYCYQIQQQLFCAKRSIC